MRNPAKLAVLPVAEDLAVTIYQITRHFPRDERFGLTAQMRRAGVSIASNIVEGCHRQGNRAFLAFLYNALGSAAELELQLRLAGRLEFGRSAELGQARDHTDKVKRMLINLILSLRTAGN